MQVAQISEVMTNKTVTHEVINEEQVEESAHATKRQSINMDGPTI